MKKWPKMGLWLALAFILLQHPPPMLIAQEPTANLIIESPLPSATVPSTFLISGIAIDPSAGPNKGPGINLVRVYAGADCTGDLLGETPLDIPRPDIVEAAGLDESYLYNGFTVSASSLNIGNTLLSVCGRSTQTGLFDIHVNLPLTINNLAIAIENPLPNAEVRLPLQTSGWAIDLQSSPEAAPGIDRVAVMAKPTCEDRPLADAMIEQARPDIADALSLPEEFISAGFATFIDFISPAVQTLTYCFYEGDELVAQQTIPVTLVYENLIYDIEQPDDGDRIADDFTLSGWLLTQNKTDAAEIGIRSVAVFQDDACEDREIARTELFDWPTNIPPELLDTLGLTLQRTQFNIRLTRLLPGETQLTTCVQSNFDEWIQLDTRTVQVESRAVSDELGYSLMIVMLACIFGMGYFFSRKAY